MANYIATSRTNYFKVTDETKYEEIIKGLTSDNDKVSDFSRKDEKGNTWHAFGAYGSIYYYKNKNDEEPVEIEQFIKRLQKILDPNDAIIFTEIGHENLRYLIGYSIIATRNEIKYYNMKNKSIETAQNMLNNTQWNTEMEY